MFQEEAFNLLKMGKNIFLTGEAGSGKTYLLNKYIRYLQEHHIKVAVTASTGVAATHLQGSTIHAFSGMGVKDSLNDKDLEKIVSSERIKRNYKNTRVLIIDEISMLHKQQLEMVDAISRRMLNKDEPFGGIQVILCGDFFQLPPISSDPLSREKQFAFESNAWKGGDFHVCYLHEQHRQENDPLHVILNDIRNGTAGEHTKIPLRTRYKKEPDGKTKPTQLYCRNFNVDVINERELASINSPEKIFRMECTGFNQLVEGLKRSCLASEELKLKVGAEVMFIKNDPHGKYVNGTRCVVVGFDKNPESWPVVKTYDDEVLVAYPEEWKYEDNGIVRATIMQIPLRLAWAITIHKSQGMTLDAAEIDLGDAFEPGMGYVALSRVRKLSGLKLMNLNEMALKVHPVILQHNKIFKECSAAIVEELQNLSEDERLELQKQTLIDRFGESHTKPVKQKKEKKKKEKPVPTHIHTLERVKQKQSIKTIAAERSISISTVFNHIEKLKGLKMIANTDIEYLKNELAGDDFDILLAELNVSDNGWLTPVYQKFEGKYSYEDIRLVRLFV